MASFDDLINSFKKKEGEAHFSSHQLPQSKREVVGTRLRFHEKMKKNLQCMLHYGLSAEKIEATYCFLQINLSNLSVVYVPIYKQCDLSEEEMDMGFREACFMLYTSRDYEKAQNIFGMLIELNVLNPVYWEGCGRALEASGDYLSAAHVYFLQAAVDPNKPFGFYYAGCCYQQAERVDIARFCFQKAIEKSADEEDYSIIRNRSELSLQAIDQKNQNG